MNGVTFPDGSIYDASTDNTHGPCESPPPQPQIVRMDVDRHESWASTSPTPEVTRSHLFRDRAKSTYALFWLQSIGCLADRPEAESGNRASPHSANSENGFGDQSDFPSMSSVHFSTLNGILAPSPYNLQQHSIASTSLHPPHCMSSHPLPQFPSGSAQSITYRIFHTAAVPRLSLDGPLNLCPQCYASPFPSVWTMELLGCVHCQHWLPRSMMLQPENFPDPVPASAPAMPLDRPRSPTTCSSQNRSGKGKSPQTRGRRSAKVSSPAVEEFRCCPSPTSENLSIPCQHTTCSPPPNVGLLSRRFDENEKWVRARREAVASFSYENCGCTSAHLVSCRFSVIHQPTLIFSLQTSDRNRLDDCGLIPPARLFLYAIHPRRAISIQPQVRSSPEFDRRIQKFPQDVLQNVLGDFRDGAYLSEKACARSWPT